jgi:acetylornithine deacetylase/succinyl-diaminopimelate desuccinylase-like protein
MMRIWRRALAAMVMPAALPGLAGAGATGLRPDQVQFRGLYKELVEIHTTLSVADATSLRTPPPPPLSDAVMGPLRKRAAQIWPGVPIVPMQATGATDGKYTNAAGIPTYGLTGIFAEANGGGTHGLNERIRVKSLYDARDFLYVLVKDYPNQK